VSVTVSCVDDAPTAARDARTVDEDAPATSFDVLANDSDPDGGPKTIAAVTQPANGTVVRAGDGSNLSYRPNAGYCNSQSGGTPDTFTYTLNGGSQATVSVTVSCAPAVDPPARDTFAPSLTDLSLTNKRFVVRRRGRPTPVGTVFNFSLSESARVSITIQRVRSGRRASAAGRSARLTTLGVLGRKRAAGPASVRFRGRPRGRALRPGSYRATFVATDAAGNASAPQRLSFTVLVK